MSTSQRSYLSGNLSQAVVEFFRDYGVECTTVEVVDDRHAAGSVTELGSVVGFKGARFRGGLAVVAPAELVARLLPVPRADEHAELQLRDWASEIANQVAGRLKNKLPARSFDVDVGSAVCLAGMSMRLSYLPEASAVALGFTIGSVELRVFLDCAFIDDEEPTSSGARWVLPEGNVVIFPSSGV